MNFKILHTKNQLFVDTITYHYIINKEYSKVVKNTNKNKNVLEGTASKIVNFAKKDSEMVKMMQSYRIRLYLIEEKA